VLHPSPAPSFQVPPAPPVSAGKPVPSFHVRPPAPSARVRRPVPARARVLALLASGLMVCGCGVDSSPDRAGEPAEIRGRVLVAGSPDQGGSTVMLDREAVGRPAPAAPAASDAPSPSAPSMAGLQAEEGLGAIDHGTTTTDHEGWYRFRDVEPGRYQITGSRGDASSVVARGVIARADQETVVGDIVLTLIGSVAGRVELAGLTDHSGVVVFIPRVTAAQITGPGGEFNLAGIPAGAHTIVAERFGYTVSRAGVVVPAGQVADAGVLRLTTDPPSGSDQVAPAVSIASPLHEAVIQGITTVSITATDAVGVDHVILFVDAGDGTLRPTALHEAPYTYDLDVAALGGGSEEVRLYAEAFDTAGNVARSDEVVCPLTCQYGDLPELAGILQTDESGQSLGGDTSDWCLNPSVPGSIPTAPYLDPAFPNPATSAVTIYFGTNVAQAIDYLVIVDEHCRTIQTLLSGQVFSAGNYPVFWDCTNENNERVEPGLYRAIIKMGSFTCYGDIQVDAP